MNERKLKKGMKEKLMANKALTANNYYYSLGQAKEDLDKIARHKIARLKSADLIRMANDTNASTDNINSNYSSNYLFHPTLSLSKIVREKLAEEIKRASDFLSEEDSPEEAAGMRLVAEFIETGLWPWDK